MDVVMEAPARAALRPVRDLAEPLGITPAAVYAAVKRGHIGGTLQVGALIKIRPDAFEYHIENGFGANVPPYSG